VKSFYKEILKVVKKIVGEREITLQEATLDAQGLPLITYSCDARYIQAKPPNDTVLTAMRAKDRAKRQRTEGPDKLWSYVYDPSVVKYVKRPVGVIELQDGTHVNMDKVCMYEYFSEYNITTFDVESGTYKVKKRKNPCIVIPTPIMKPSHDNERWCYQMLMLFTPFRNHEDVLRHPEFRQLDIPAVTDYRDNDFPTDGLADNNTQEEVAPTQTRVVEEEEEENVENNQPEDHGLTEPIRATQLLEEEEENLSDVAETDLRRDIDLPPQEGLYKFSTDLFRQVFGRVRQGWWPEKYVQISSILEAIEGVMKDAYLDQGTIPSRDEFMAMLRRMGPEVEGAMDVDEFLTAAVADQNLKQTSKLVDDPDRGMFSGHMYERNVEDARRTRREYFTKHKDEIVVKEGPRRTYQNILDNLDRVRRSIKNQTGKYKGLRVRQKAVLLVVLNTLEDTIKVDADVLRPDQVRTTRLILQGEAGTGKTFVLKSLVDLCCTFLSPKAIKVFAPTANAARVYETCACKSSTFHKVWKKSVNEFERGSRKNAPLIGEALMEWMTTMKGVKALICDEMSMLSPSDIHLMSSRLTDAYCGVSSNRPKVDFNGLPIVIICGDLYQLPPVMAQPLYRGEQMIDEIKQKKRDKASRKGFTISEAELDKNVENPKLHNEGTEIYRRFFNKAIILNENVRQEGDMEWRKLLRRVRLGTATEEDQSRLLLRVWTMDKVDPRKKEAEVWRTCPRYYPRVEDILRESTKMFKDINPNPSLCFDVSPKVVINGRDADAKELKPFGNGLYRLAYPLLLAVDTPVMITQNTIEGRDWGVVNGSTGIVKGYVSKDGIRINYVLVLLDAPLAEMPPLRLQLSGDEVMVMPGVWPVPLVSKTTLKFPNGKQERTEISIRRFPLQLAYALTIHKAQGITVENAVVDITNCFVGQMPYVALSRITKEEGLMLARAPTLCDINKFATSEEKPLLEAELERIAGLQGELLEELGLLEEDEEVVRRLESELAE